MEFQFSLPVVPARAGAHAADALVHRFALDSRARHTRRSSPRTRAGCATCKRRHVKCDETKPACANCLKWRGYCDSYEPVLPKEPVVNVIRFASGDQRAYFDAWSSLSASFLSGGLGQTRLWTATMPQLTLDETTLRFGAMAVGALHKAYEVDGPSAALGSGNRHYVDAVVYYCEALRLQSEARPTREGLRTALLSSLLFICFEAQRGNLAAALKHVTHGFSMLNELAAGTERAPDLVSIAPAPPALVQEILDCYKPLELQSRSFVGSYNRFFFSSPRPRAPPAAAASALPSARILPFTKHSPYFRPKISSITSLQDIPAVFGDTDEALGYWALVQKNMVQNIPMLTAVTSRLGLTHVVSEAELGSKLASVKQNASIADFITEARYWLQRWIEAYEPLFCRLSRDAAKDPKAHLQAINIRVEYLVLYVYTTMPRFSGIFTAKGLTPQYTEINKLAETLLRARPSCGFAMDSGWTWPLFVTAFGCRDAAVRADAIRILGQYPMRNALRDSRVFRAIALKNAEVEAATAAEGDETLQWLRLRRRELVFEDFGASIIFRSCQRDPATGRWGLVEEAADFCLRPDGSLDWQRVPISDSASILSGVC